MKLAIVIYSLSGGGAERVVSYLLSYCSKHNIKVFLICMNITVKYDIPDDIEIHFIEKSKHNENGIIKALKIPLLAYKYSRLVKKLGITHSISFLTRPAFINVLSRKLTSYQYKVITNERAYPSLQYSYKGFQSVFNKILIKLLYNKSDLVISNSHGNAQDLINNFRVPSEKMKIIHNPIDLDKIEKIEPINSFYDTTKINLITLGRLDKGKNHSMLIRAVKKLQNPSVRLYIFGSGNLKNELEQLIIQLSLTEQVILMDFTPNPYQYLKAADLFVFGSNHEGFPNVLLEAMACGLPILSTNCKSGPSEIMELKTVKNDIMKTDYGILTPIQNVELMAKGLNYLLTHNEYLTTCKENVKKRIQDFNKEKMLKEYMDLIKLTV